MAFSKTTKQLFAALIFAGVIIGSWAIWYVFFKPHRDVSTEKPAFTMTAEALDKAFETGEGMANYIDKAILIEGAVTEVGESYIALGNIICNFEGESFPKPGKVNLGDNVQIQGRVSTYNDLMDEIVLDKCDLK